jgi:hypothetical protein
MKNRYHSLNVLFAVVVFFVMGLPVNAAETVSAPASAVQGSATLPPDGSPFTPDSPEKEKRVKKLIKQITATYGFSRGREELLPSWGPRTDKLYSLHKKLTNDDWKLLAEMYISFTDSNWKNIAGISSDDYLKDTLNFDNAIKILLAMHGEASINTLNSMVAFASTSLPKYKKNWRGFKIYNKAWQGQIDTLKEFNRNKFWSYLPEYKKDQQQKNY